MGQLGLIGVTTDYGKRQEQREKKMLVQINITTASGNENTDIVSEHIKLKPESVVAVSFYGLLFPQNTALYS